MRFGLHVAKAAVLGKVIVIRRCLWAILYQLGPLSTAKCGLTLDVGLRYDLDKQRQLRSKMTATLGGRLEGTAGLRENKQNTSGWGP